MYELVNIRCCLNSNTIRPTSKKGRHHHIKEKSSAYAFKETQLKCPYFQECPGCTIDNKLDQPATLQHAVKYFQTHGIDKFEFSLGDVHGWRRRSRLAVRQVAESREVSIGLFQSRTHNLVPINECPVHHPVINTACALVKRSLSEVGIEPYSETTCSGELRYIQVSVVDGGMVQLILVWNSTSITASLQNLTETILSSAPNGLLHSVWANYNTSASNTILSSSFQLLYGQETSCTKISGVDIYFSPGSFTQANLAALESALLSMSRFIKKGSTIADLHAGVGTIGLTLASMCDLTLVRCIEINSSSEESFWRSVETIQTREPCTFEYHVAKAGSNPGAWLKDIDTALFDPPRKGLEESLIEYLVDCSNESALPDRLIYLSCGYPALERDCTRLVDSGLWTVVHAEAFSFFPGTDHIESLVIFDKV